MTIKRKILSLAMVPFVAITAFAMLFLQGCKPALPDTYGMVKENPMLINSAQDFSAIKPEYKYVKMTKDIRLGDLENAFADGIYLIEMFDGEFDGNGKTIIFDGLLMPPSQFSDLSSCFYLFKEFNGVLKNVTLEFDVIGTPYAFACECTKETSFENCTTVGDIFITRQVSSYSPFLAVAEANITFRSCESKVNIEGAAYGSAFLGGHIWNPSGEVFEDAEATKLSSPATTGYVKDIKVKFENCVNYGRIAMVCGAMLYGNGFTVPQPENLTISNCYNLGTIVGARASALFCSNVVGVESNLYPYRDPVSGRIKEYNDLADEVNELAYNTNNIAAIHQGSVVKLHFDNDASLVMDAQKRIKIKQQETAKSRYSYKIKMTAFLKDVDGENSYYIMFDKELACSDDDVINTNLKALTFVGENFIKTYLNKDNFEQVCIEDAADSSYSVIKSNIKATSTESTSVDVYIINYNGTSYYYFDFKDSNGNTINYEATFHGEIKTNISMTRSVLVYEADAYGVERIVGELSRIEEE